MRILVTGAWQGYRDCEEELKSAGHELTFMQWEKDPLPVGCDWPEAIIGNGIFLTHPIEKFTNLRYIQLTSAGYDRVDMEFVRTHGIQIYNARGVYSIPMAEFALGGVLQLYKQYGLFADSQKKHEWNKIRNIRELNQSKVVIIGCGSVGTECAKRFKAFDCQVVGVDLFPREDAFYDTIRHLQDIDQLIPDADILVLTLPLTNETKGLLSRRRMEALKKEAIIVNIARGGVMDYQAFIDLKNSERSDLMAVLDVFEQEPLDENSPIWDMDGVVVTPHNSFVGNRNPERLNSVIIKNLG